MSSPRSPQPPRDFAPWDTPGAVPLIRFEGVTKRFGDVTAVDKLNLEIYEREFFALLGASGCGKTTLLRMLAGFETPTEGRITLDGRDVSHTPPHKRPVNMMFQSYALFPHMTVEQNIAFGLKQEGMAQDKTAERVREMLALVQLDRFARRKPHQLSGGQRQRVALARSLAKKPRLLLLDEPLGALDKKLREQTQFELTDLQAELGLTFVIVTHDQEEAMTVADRIALMRDGRIEQIGIPGEIYENPATRYAADFIGDVNLFQGTVTASDDAKVTVEIPHGETLFTVRSDRAVKSGQPVTIAVRPEKVRISADPPADAAANTITGEVWDIGYLGDMSIYHVKLPDDGPVVKAAQVNTSRVATRVITWEDTVHLSFAPDAGVLLTE